MKSRKTRLSDGKDLISQFMRERDFPDWYRALSQNQLDAADSLQNNIRDDVEQGTSHRIRVALIRIGIAPLASASKIKLAMRLGRGNDIAFLWFLMELYYKSHESNKNDEKKNHKYTVNEQIFMSIIAHLDTIPTLRELDKLLPKKISKPRVKKVRKFKIPKFTYLLPYFEKQRKPVPYGKSLILNEASNEVRLGSYEKYLDPYYLVGNEQTRWFSKYVLSPSKRIEKKFVESGIDKIFDRGKNGTDKEMYPVFCLHHTSREALKDSKVNEIKVAAKVTCEKFFNLDQQLKEKYSKCVQNFFEEELFKRKLLKKKYTNANTTRCMSRKCINANSTIPSSGYQQSFVPHSYLKPFSLNYFKIFDSGPKNPIKDAVSNALNSSNSSGHMSIDHNRKIQKCCRDIWTAELKKYEDQTKQNKRSTENKMSSSPQQTINYDPHNATLMKSLLYEGIQEMTKNKQFVLASLPDAHKYPLLKEWIRKRYGIVYTRTEKNKNFQLSKKVFQALKRNNISGRVPELCDLSSKRVVSYGCKKYWIKKINMLKKSYYRDSKLTLMEAARIYWEAIRPYQCSRGPPRNEFFAYLPARENDIHMLGP